MAFRPTLAGGLAILVQVSYWADGLKPAVSLELCYICATCENRYGMRLLEHSVVFFIEGCKKDRRLGLAQIGWQLCEVDHGVKKSDNPVELFF